MSNYVDKLLNEVLAVPPSSTPNALNDKMQDVSAASAVKQLDFGQLRHARATGKGSLGADDFKWDMQNLGAGQIQQKYGPDAARELERGLVSTRGQTEADLLARRNRHTGNILWDTASGVGSGFAGSIGGLAALGTSLVNEEAGAAVGEGVQDAMEWVEGTQSDAVNAVRRRQRTISALDISDNTFEHEQRVAGGDSEFVSGLRRWGADAVDTLKNSGDGTMFAQGTAEGVGSLLAGGPIAKSLRAVGSTALNLGKVGGTGARIGPKTQVVDRITRAGEWGAWPAAIAGMEAGGAYSGTVSEIMEMPHETLIQTSEPYRALLAEGMSPDKAKLEIANNAGHRAAVFQGLAGLATGSLSRWAETPFKVPTFRSGAANVLLKEPTEEGLQGASGAVAQNESIQRFADESRSISEGAGEQTAQGALYGIGAAGAVQGPGLVRRAPKAVGKVAWKAARGAYDLAVKAGTPAFNAYVERGRKAEEAAENASPVSNAAIKEAADAVVAAGPQLGASLAAVTERIEGTPEQKAAVTEYTQSLVQAMNLDPEIELRDLPPALVPALEGVTGRVDAIQRVAYMVERLPEGNDQLLAAAALNDLIQPILALQTSDPELAAQMRNDPEVGEVLQQLESVVMNIETPVVQRAMRTINQLNAQAQAQQNIQPVTEESLATAEGQQNVRNAVAIAELAPDKGNLQANEQILEHAKSGKLNLTLPQLRSLQASVSLLRARAELEKGIAEKGLKTAKDVVSSQILTGQDPARKIAKSSAQHVMEVLRGMRGKNTEYASFKLEDFGKFVQHMKNKLEANIKHFENGDAFAPGVPYMQLLPNDQREFKLYKKGEYVNLSKADSIEHAQAIALEAKIVSNVYNGLVRAFPELLQPEITMPSLPAGLEGKAADIAREFNQGRALAKSKPAATQPTPEVRATPEQVAEKKARFEKERAERKEAKAKPEPTEVEVAPLEEAQVDEADEAEANRRAEQEQEAQPEVETETQIEAQSASDAPLYNPEKNMFMQAFTKPAEPKTRVGYVESPAQFVVDSMSSSAKFKAALGEAASRNKMTRAISDAYAEYLSLDPEQGNLGALLGRVGKNLETFLKRKYSKDNPITFGELLLSNSEITKKDGQPLKGDELATMVNAKTLSLVTQTGETFQYEQRMLEQAGLAALQWMLSAAKYQSVMTAQDVSDITGVENPSPQLVKDLSSGISSEQAVRTLAQKISQYWGMNAKKDAPDGFTDGIPQAMAAEMIRGLVDLGMVQMTPYNVPETELPEGSDPVTVNRYVVVEQESPMSEFPDAIEAVVMLNPERNNYLGDEKPPVAQRQMNNPEVANTPAQKEAIQKEQETTFFINRVMTNFFQALGSDNLVKLLGTEVGDTVWNQNDLKSIEGKNRSISEAFKHAVGVMKNIENTAAALGLKPEEVAIRYAYNMSRVGRMHMLGKYNPQGSKLVREMFMPTKSTLDLSQPGDAWDAYTLGLGQALGVKVHNKVLADSQADLNTRLEKLTPVIDMLREWSKDPTVEFTDAQVDLIKSEMSKANIGMTEVALHALMDYARFMETADKSKFETSVYLEADGVTNGPFNAMALMSIGSFTAEWLQNIRKGGLTIGDSKALADIRRDDSKDMYETAADATRTRLKELHDDLASDKSPLGQKMVQQMRHVLNLMDLFTDGLDFDPTKGDLATRLQVDRSVIKNPLTITVYGAGAAGIGNKLVGEIIDAIYSKMSAVAQQQASNKNISAAEAMFPNDPDADAKMQRFREAFGALTTETPKRSKEGKLFFKTTGQRRTSLKPQTFTITKEEFSTFSANMLQFFVEPMRSGITDVLGGGLMQAVGLVRDATHIQSIIYHAQYVQEMNALIEQKKKNDPNWRSSDFLSKKEIEGIVKKLNKVAPLVKTEDQTFMVARNERIALNDRALHISAGLDNSMRTGPQANMPGEAGVRGIPMLTIGMGDGMMMQILAAMGLEGTLKIFDGMNMPLDKIMDYSNKANQAVYESIQGNPLRAIEKSYRAFLESYDKDAVNQDTFENLVRTLFEPRFRKEATVEDVIVRIEDLLSEITSAANSIDARHKALMSMPMSVDQMAAAGMPFTNGVEALGTMSDAEVAAELNRRYQEFLTTEPIPQRETTLEISTPARVSESGATVLTWDNLPKAMKKLDSDQKTVWDQIKKSLAAKAYTVVSGTAEQLQAYVEENGLTAQVRRNINNHGWMNIGDQTIFLIDPAQETLLHELVHASSYETLLDYYAGKPVPEGVKEAIQRLEILMQDFLDMGAKDLPPESKETYWVAKDVINEKLKNNKAGALNEFMAWTLSNQKLIAALKERKAPKLVQLVKNVIAQLKKLIWGRKHPPQLSDDFYSNLVFNSSIIFMTQPTLGEVGRTGELFHNHAYGTSDRIASIRKALGQKIIDYLKDERYQKDAPMRRTVQDDAIQAANDIMMQMNASGFSMTPQEQATFHLVVQALATENDIDGNALARAQELYAHVAKNLTVESFMADPNSQNPADRYYAQQKYDMIMGKTLVKKDIKGRSSLLPAFLGLAIVNDDFRTVLSKLPLPKSAKNQEGTLDSWLENSANTIMDKLSDRLSGDMDSKDVREAIDNLTQHIRQTLQREQTMLDKFASTTGGWSDSLNNTVVDGLGRLSDGLMEKASKIEQTSQNALVRTGARITQLLASIVSEKNGQIVAEQTMTMLNKSGVWEPFSKLLSDLAGRTQSNKLIYDMIKVTRSMVQQVRQQFREETPRVIMGKFKGVITDSQWVSQYRAMAKTDLAVLRDSMSHKEIQKLFTDANSLSAEINKREQLIQGEDAAHWNLLKKKMQQLAGFLNDEGPGPNLLRNATAVAGLFQERVNKGRKLMSPKAIKAIDELITLYTVEKLSDADKQNMSLLVQSEADGLAFSLDYLVGQRKEEIAKAEKTRGLINGYKGFIPSEQQPGVSLIVADDADFAQLRQRGYIRVAAYKGSSTDSKRSSKGYYYSPLGARPLFNQGIMQNVRHTSGGVDSVSGYTVGHMAGRITDRHAVRRAASLMKSETNYKEALMPVFNEFGVVVALERPMDPVQMKLLQPSEHLPRMIGVWRGRQMEEALSQKYNEKLVDNLKLTYDNDMKESSSNQKQYVNLFSDKLDAVQRDAVSLFTDQTLEYIRATFGEEFWVRKDMLDDAIGYRSATVGDIWTGNTRWSKNTQDTVRQALTGAFGVDAYKWMVRSEQVVQNLMADARTLIVIKSVVVPAANLMSNMYQLISRGVPVLNIGRSLPKKLAEIESYTRTKLRLIDAEAELRAAVDDPIAQRKLKVEIQTIEDAHRRLSIWPLLEAGEFSTIADVGMTSEDLEMTSGKLVQWVEKKVDQLPEGVRNAGRYALITRDTALFQGLQKSVQYGDFIAKAILYDDLVNRKRMSTKDALGRVTEEFVNYDRLPGRFRGYMENVGLLWFYNFKIRISKIAVSTIRNNPVHALVAMGLPTVDVFGEISLPQEDSLLSKVAEGTIDNSMGPGMALNAPSLNPWWNLVD